MFQLEKSQKRIMVALESGAMKPEDMSPEEAARVAQYMQDESKLDHQYFLDKARQRKRRQPPVRMDLRGQHVFVDEASVPDQQARAIRLKARRSGMHTCQDRMAATVFVVEDLASIGQRNTLCAGMIGGLVCTPCFLESLGSAGASIKFKSAIAKKRIVHATAAFIAGHPMIYNLISTLSHTNDSKWRWIADKNEFVALTRRLRASGQAQANFMAFAMPNEKGNQDNAAACRAISDVRV